MALTVTRQGGICTTFLLGAGHSKFPIPAVLRDRLDTFLLDAPATGRIFFNVRESYDNGRDAADAAKVRAPTLHACRHGYASLMIAAGRQRQGVVHLHGRANMRITLDQYGAESEATATQTATHPA